MFYGLKLPSVFIFLNFILLININAISKYPLPFLAALSLQKHWGQDVINNII